MWWATIALAGELSGTLTGAAGEPVVGATVYAYDSRYNYASATTRSGGEWTLTGLPADRYRLRFLPPNHDPHADRFRGGAWDVCDTEPVELADEEGALGGLDEALPVGGEVVGVVTDAAGTPVSGIRVTVTGAEPRTALVLRGDNTDADGSFSITGLDAEATGSAFRVSFAGEGWPDQWLGGVYDTPGAEAVTASAGGVTDLGTRAILDGIRVSGTVSGPDGPVASGTAYAYSGGQVLGVTVGDDGRYDADGLPPGEVIVWASSSGLATTYYPAADRPGDSLSVPEEGSDVSIDLALPAESTLTVHAEGELEEVSLLLYNDTYTVGRGDRFDSSGKVTFTGLWPGRYFLYVSGADGGYESGFYGDSEGERVAFAVDGPTVADVTLAPGARLSGTVTDDAGQPVYGAAVVATDTLVDARTWSTTTARDGTWALPGVAGTELRLAVSYAWYCPDDAGYAPIWYADARSEGGAAALLVGEGEAVEGLDVVLPRDAEHDGMGDAWEAEAGLDPARDDAAEDPDGDGYTNHEEWVLGSDPVEADAAPGDCGAQGCAGGGALGLLGVFAGALRRRARR